MKKTIALLLLLCIAFKPLTVHLEPEIRLHNNQFHKIQLLTKRIHQKINLITKVQAVSPLVIIGGIALGVGIVCLLAALVCKGKWSVSTIRTLIKVGLLLVFVGVTLLSGGLLAGIIGLENALFLGGVAGLFAWGGLFISFAGFSLFPIEITGVTLKNPKKNQEREIKEGDNFPFDELDGEAYLKVAYTIYFGKFEKVEIGFRLYNSNSYNEPINIGPFEVEEIAVGEHTYRVDPQTCCDLVTTAFQNNCPNVDIYVQGYSGEELFADYVRFGPGRLEVLSPVTRYTKYTLHGLHASKALIDTFNPTTLFCIDESDYLEVKVDITLGNTPSTDWGLVIKNSSGETIWTLPADQYSECITENQYKFKISDDPPEEFMQPLPPGDYSICLDSDLTKDNELTLVSSFTVSSSLPNYWDWSEDPNYAKMLVCYKPNQNEQSFIIVPIKVEDLNNGESYQIKQVYFELEDNPSYTTDEIEKTAPISILLPNSGENDWNEIYISFYDTDKCPLLSDVQWDDPSIWDYSPKQSGYPQFEITTDIMPQPTLNFPLQTAAFKPAVKPQAVTPSNSILYRLTSASALNGVTSFFFSPSFENYSTVLKFYAMSVFYYKDLDSYNGKIHLISWNGSMFSEKPVIVNSNQPVFLCPVVEGKLKNGSDVYLTPTAVANKLFAEIFKYNETNPASSSYQTVPVVDFTNYDNFPVDTWVFYVHQIRGERNGNSMPTWYDAVSEDTADQNRGYAAVAPVRITKDQEFCFSFSKEEGSYWFAASTSNTTMGSRLECRTAGYQAYRASVQRFKRVSFKRNVSGEDSVAVWASAFINVPYWLNHSHLTVAFNDSTPVWENAFYGVDCSGLWWAANRAAGNSSYPLRRADEYHNNYVSLRQLPSGQSTDNDTNGDCIEDHSEPDWVRNRVSRVIESGDAWFIDWDKDPGDRYPVDHMGIVSSYVPQSVLNNQREGDPPPFTIIHASAGRFRRVVRPDYSVTKNPWWCGGEGEDYDNIFRGVGK